MNASNDSEILPPTSTETLAQCLILTPCQPAPRCLNVETSLGILSTFLSSATFRLATETKEFLVSASLAS